MDEVPGEHSGHMLVRVKHVRDLHVNLKVINRSYSHTKPQVRDKCVDRLRSVRFKLPISHISLV